jgi:hypothetical protein
MPCVKKEQRTFALHAHSPSRWLKKPNKLKEHTVEKPILSEVPVMRHRLRNCLSWWQGTTTSLLILGIIAYGYKIRWDPEKGPPPACYQDNHNSCIVHEKFVDAQIAELVEAQSIEEVNDCPHVLCPLGVVEQAIFLDLQYAWDMLFDTDLFASHESRQTHRFYSFFWTPGNSGVEAFTQL